MDNNFLILVGGMSGSGKTTLVSKLIQLYPKNYSRPTSYTTRQKRIEERDDEYLFVSLSAFEEMKQAANFLNVDFVYGNYYAMTHSSIDQIIKKDMIAIKEIHPSNHAKIKESYDGKVISILIKSFDVIEDDLHRRSEDQSFYNSICEDDFDIVYFNDTNLSPEISAMYLHKKIQIFITFYGAIPSAGEIDKLNRLGYSKAAEYFTEEKRITTRNFHELSASFFADAFNKFVNPNTKIVEIGPGQGWLVHTVSPMCKSYTGVDISATMAEKNPNIDKVTTSARCIPIPSENYDVVVASLADPYFYPEVLCEVERILVDKGYFIFSLPADEWAGALRCSTKTRNRTVFILNSGEQAEVYSFTFTVEELSSLMQKCGFERICVSSTKAIELAGKEVSTAIIQAAKNIKKNVNELEIVTTAIFQKKEANTYDKS